MIAKMAVYPQQRPAPTILRVGQVKPAQLEQCIPTVYEVPVRAQHIQVSPTVEELRILSILLL